MKIIIALLMFLISAFAQSQISQKLYDSNRIYKNFIDKKRLMSYLEDNLISPNIFFESLKDINYCDTLIIVELGSYEITNYSFLLYESDSLSVKYYDDKSQMIQKLKSNSKLLSNLILSDILVGNTDILQSKYRERKCLTKNQKANIITIIKNQNNYDFKKYIIYNVGYPKG
jgi:hypothetical protein